MKCVIFDCDGVLVQTEHIANRVFQECLREYGVEMLTAEFNAHFIGRSTRDCLVWVKENKGVDISIEEFREVYNPRREAAFAEGVVAVPGVVDLIARIEQAGLPFCVASTSSQPVIESHLKAIGVYEKFAGHTYSCVDLNVFKPNPDIFLHAADQMGFTPEECIVIEDSVPGVWAAVNAGIPVYWYQADFHREEPVYPESAQITRIQEMGEVKLS
jgi:HAD superfamily hydrolase (TIGR01509 family)